MGRYSKEYYQKNKDRILIYQRRWKRNNKDKINEQRRRYFKGKKEKDKEIKRLKSASLDDIERNIQLYRKGKNLDMSFKKLGPLFKDKLLQEIKKIESIKRKCIECGNIFLTNHRIYCSPECNKKATIRLRARNRKRRMNTDSVFMIKTRLRDRLREAIRWYLKHNKIRKSEDYLDFEAIIKQLGPCPGNRRDYHIDHIIPLCKFDLSKEEDIKKAFAPTNLQWLLIKENLKKGML